MLTNVLELCRHEVIIEYVRRQRMEIRVTTSDEKVDVPIDAYVKRK